MPDRYGASEDRWAYWTDMLGGPADLLPVVSNPNAKISATSTLKTLGKTPSRYNSKGEVVGIGDWTQVSATRQEVRRWSQEPNYGVCIQTRRLRAIDYDADDHHQSDHILDLLGGKEAIPYRYRSGSYRLLIPFWYEGPLAKHVIPVETGMIEILADGQQFVAEGWHASGDHYKWEGDGDIPVLDELDFAMLLADLKEMATGPVKIARGAREKRNDIELDVEDDVADWLVGNWEVYDHGKDGQLFIRCPFDQEHTSDSGPTSTAYFPAGTGGHAEGHFVCLHAHCTGRGDAEFLHATGATAGGFDDLGEGLAGRPPVVVEESELRGSLSSRSDGADETGTDGGAAVSGQCVGTRLSGEVDAPWPRLTRDGQHRIEPTMRNLLLAIAHPDMTKRHIAYDVFLDELMWAPLNGTAPSWRAWRDSDYAWLRKELEERGFKAMSQDMLRLAVLSVAEKHQVDQAQTWLGGLTWDGTERIERFASLGWGWTDSAYSRAVGRYVWTGLAGRVIQPGVQCDMAPILVGPQGALKTSAVKAMSPAVDFYSSIKLHDKDADTSRKMRGRLVVELEELRGINSRAIEEIKAFITHTHEEWVPKFKEFRTLFARRCMLFGTTNDDEFLADPTGERRWLPGWTDKTDPEWIAEHRDQLWAEGAARFLLDGVDWLEAEKLARGEHNQFKIEDPWTNFVIRWLHDDDAMAGGKPMDRPYLTIADALTGAVNMRPDAITHAIRMRMGKVLIALGYSRERKRVDGEPTNIYVKS